MFLMEYIIRIQRLTFDLFEIDEEYTPGGKSENV